MIATVLEKSKVCPNPRDSRVETGTFKLMADGQTITASYTAGPLDGPFIPDFQPGQEIELEGIMETNPEGIPHLKIERYRFIGADLCNLCGMRSRELQHSRSKKESNLSIPTPICPDCKYLFYDQHTLEPNWIH